MAWETRGIPIVASLVGAVGAFIAATWSNRQNRELAEQASDLSERSLEEIRRIAVSLKKGVQWSIRWERGDTYLITNVGDATATDLRFEGAIKEKLIDAVERGEEVTLTRHGKPVAVLVRPDRLRSRRAEAAMAEAAETHELLDSARSRPLSAGTGLAPGRADELVAQMRADRDRR